MLREVFASPPILCSEQSPFGTLAVIIMINKTVVTMLFVGAKFVSENNDDEIPQKSV
jgi:hypothetical protein